MAYLRWTPIDVVTDEWRAVPLTPSDSTTMRFIIMCQNVRSPNSRLRGVTRHSVHSNRRRRERLGFCHQTTSNMSPERRPLLFTCE